MNFKIKNYELVCCMALMLLTSLFNANAQVARKHLSAKHQHYYDSLRNMEYDRTFPLFGDKVYKKGFDIPFPFGIMINSFYGNQSMEISNIKVGIKAPDNTLAPVDLDKVIAFSKVEAIAYNVNLRADMYVFPFLNVYAMINWIPNARTRVELSKPVQIATEPEQDGWAWGVGVMGAGGLGPVWIQADYNLTWADMELLQNKVFTQISGIRIGHVFSSRKSGEKNISVWIGMMGIFMNNETIGSIPLNSLFEDVSQEKVDEIKQSYDSWYDGLQPLQKNVVDGIMEKLQDKVDGLPVDDIYITYELDKAPASRWAGLMGIQFQFNKRWQLRCESNFIGGDRFSVLTSLNYRFLGFKKKKIANTQ